MRICTLLQAKHLLEQQLDSVSKDATLEDRFEASMWPYT